MNYRSHILRLWQESASAADAEPTWRFSLEDVHTGERRGFADLAALCAHLQAQTASVTRHEDQQPKRAS